MNQEKGEAKIGYGKENVFKVGFRIILELFFTSKGQENIQTEVVYGYCEKCW